MYVLDSEELTVSIRAPAWGATVDAWDERIAAAEFQFALPRGERPSANTSTICAARFNSRSRVGSDIAISS